MDGTQRWLVAWVKEQNVDANDGKVVAQRVHLNVTSYWNERPAVGDPYRPSERRVTGQVSVAVAAVKMSAASACRVSSRCGQAEAR